MSFGRPHWRHRIGDASRALVAALALLAGVATAAAGETSAIRIGVLKFGTVNWLMDVIRHHGLDGQNGFRLDMVELAGRDGASIALQAGDVDVITSDWFWALRARGEGDDILFAPYSASLGAVVAKADGPVSDAKDLVGKRLGVAGGPLDKSWLLLRGYGEKTLNVDFAEASEPAYGAPPLLSEQLLSGNLDAVLTYWHFAARLEGSGLKQVLGVPEMMDALGISPAPPLVGFVWSEARLAPRAAAMTGFLKAVRAANEILATSDAEWDRIRPLMQAGNDSEFAALRKRYREGIVAGWTDAYTGSARTLYDTLAAVGGAELVDEKTRFDPAIFVVTPP